MKARIAGIGAYAPERVVTNDQLSEIVDTSDEWIRSRTGISERRISTGETTRDLAAEAARRALKAAGVDARELDIIILGTSSPDNNYPSDACSVQAMIGAENAVAFDISAACAGFIFAMNIVHGFFQAGIYKTALIIGAYSEIDAVRQAGIVAAGFFLSRCLSGIAAMTFPGAKKEGLLYMFTSKAHERTVKTALFLQTAAVAVLMLYLDGVTGVAVLVGAGLTFLYYYKKCKKELGGITGDTEGYFVTVCECVIVVAAAVCEIIR